MSTRSVIVRLEAEVAGYVAGMGRAGRATDDVARQVVQARRSTEANQKAMETAGKVMLGFGTATVAGLGASAKAAMDWESAWAGVTKTVNGTPEQLNELEHGLRGLAKTLPLTHEEIAGVAEAAGQLGVAREDILGFTKTMIDLGVSTNLTADEAATNIAQISNVMGTMARDGSEGISRFGATLVALGNNGASTEKDILSMAQRIAGAAATVGASETDVLALSNTLASMGVKAELGGGVTTRVLLKMYAAVKDGGSKLDAFAKAAGTSAAEFAKAYGESPVQALDMVDKGLARIKDSGGNVVQTMKDMGIKGTEENQVMLALAASGDLLSDSLKLGSKSWDENTALVAEATKRYETTESKVKIAWNNIKDAAIDAGAVLLPVIQGVAESVSGLAQTFGSLPKPVQGVITTLGGVIGVAALVGGGMLTLLPKINDARTAFRDLDRAGSRIPGTFNRIAKAGAVAGGLVAVTSVLAKWAESDYMSKIDTGMGKVDLTLQQIANDAPGASSALDGLFRNKDGRDLINSVDDLDSALKRTFRKDGGQSFNDWGESLIHGMTGVKGSSQILGDQFDRLDQGLADMVSSGNAEDAAAGFSKVQKAAADQSIGIDELLTKFPAYADALKQAEADANAAGAGGDKAAAGIKGAGNASEAAVAQAKEVADALDEIGVSADGTATDLVKFTDALLNAGLINLSARDAARNYQAAIDAVGESVAKNGITLQTNTEQGRANQAALDGIASAGFNLIKANAANGDSQKSLQGNLTDTYNKLIAGAGQFNITGDAAKNLARDILHVPKGVSIESWMSSEAKRMAEQTKNALDNVPKSVTIHTYDITHKITSIETQVKGGGSAGDPSDTALRPGTLRPNRAGGGDLDMAPGPKGVDSQLFMGAKGEHVFTAQEVDKMGGQQAVYQFRANVRAGNFQGLAGGGAVGHTGTMYSPASPSGLSIDYDRLAQAVGEAGNTYQFTVDRQATAAEFFDEAQYQTRVRDRGGKR